MVFSFEFLGLILLVTSAAALGLSIIVDVGKYSAERARAALLNRQYDKKKQALADWKQKSEKKVVDLREAQARLAELLGKKQRLAADIKAMQLNKIEFIHEVGEWNDSAMGFWCQLIVGQNFAQADRHDIIFSRQIWDYRNVAHVWGVTSDHAATILKQAFSLRSGVQPSQMLPLAFAPDGSVMETAQ